jgi:uncharacterized protein with ParB-like and HNH nuclease domain
MKANETNVLSLIGGLDKVFIIPPFQRNYEWGYEQCTELFNDIIKAYNIKRNHYLGNIVYFVGENNGASYNEFILIDGQQRVTSILLLLCALRDSADNDSLFNSINKRYLVNDTGDNRYRIRLKQTAYDSECFTEIIDRNFRSMSSNNISRNYLHFKKLINSSMISPKDIYETITKLEVVDVNLQIENDLAAIQTIFEKINSTGKQLTPADLIRNYLLLANNSCEQEELYHSYWVKIENRIKNENISRFARDYLILNIFEDVQDKNIYKMFKEYFDKSNIAHKDILNDLYKYSEYYEWLKFENCPIEKIRKVIKLLNYVKSDDVYPLYLYLFEKKYDDDKYELYKILNLISDFMLRYRIVSPSGGGGALRAVVHQLLEKLNSGIILDDYESIYYELSNSNTPAGRFPNDIEFKNSLMDSVNTTYAKLVLVKIEEFEKNNELVDLSKITIEHIMPQTLTDWWVNNFGSKEAAEIIYEKYLNCIGNLAPISKSYNSKNSNKSWLEKRENLKDVQFIITSETYKFEQWDETNIKIRNDNISDRACKAITSPLDRTRKYQTKNSTNSFESGLYPISDLTTPMSGTKLEYLIYADTNYQVTKWKNLLNLICLIGFNYDNKKFEELVAENKIHKATSKTNYPLKDPIISVNKKLLIDAKKIGNSIYYSEGTISSQRARFYSKKIMDIFGLTDKIQIYVTEK